MKSLRPHFRLTRLSPYPTVDSSLLLAPPLPERNFCPVEVFGCTIWRSTPGPSWYPADSLDSGRRLVFPRLCSPSPGWPPSASPPIPPTRKGLYAGMISSLLGDFIPSPWRSITSSIWAHATRSSGALFIGFLVWLGFFAAPNLPQGIYENRPSSSSPSTTATGSSDSSSSASCSPSGARQHREPRRRDRAPDGPDSPDLYNCSMAKEKIATAHAPEAIGPYSQAIRLGNLDLHRRPDRARSRHPAGRPRRHHRTDHPGARKPESHPRVRRQQPRACSQDHRLSQGHERLRRR